MAGQLLRILSDVHFGDRASRVARLAQLRPLLADVDGVVFNGDTLDTRPGPVPHHTEACRADVTAFAMSSESPLTFLTGNHDPDLSDKHWLDLAGDEVFVLHGDVLFEDMVPWGRDAATIRQKIAELTGTSDSRQHLRLPLDERLAVWRAVAASIPQRHQSERHGLKYAFRFALDTIWPPTRMLEVLRAWRREPALAAEFVRTQRPRARYVLLGHTHRPSIRQLRNGPVIINTGSFTAPFGGFAVDLGNGLLAVRRVDYVRGEFRPGPVIAQFPLATPQEHSVQ